MIEMQTVLQNSNNFDSYGKISRSVAKALPPMARALLVTITCLINRQRNELQMSISELAEESGMSRPSVIKWTEYLERGGHLAVKRNKGGTSNDVNVYRLAGDHAKIALWNKSKEVVKDFDSQGLKDFTGVVKNFDGKDSLKNDIQKEKENDFEILSSSGEFLNDLIALEDYDPETEKQDSEPPEIVNDPVVAGRNASEIWQAAYNQLELQFDRASFDTWFKEAEFSGVEDDVFVIRVHNQYAQDMLQNRLYRNVRRVLRDVIGEFRELRFVVREKKRLAFMSS